MWPWDGRSLWNSACFRRGKQPPVFEITGLRQIEWGNEVVSIVEWKSAKVADFLLSGLFKFKGNKICEERWYTHTEQRKGAFGSWQRQISPDKSFGAGALRWRRVRLQQAFLKERNRAFAPRKE